MSTSTCWKSQLLLIAHVLSTTFIACGYTHAATHSVDSARQIESLIKSGGLSPGDVVVWADGEYTGESLNIDGVDGTSEKPITLRAATPGQVILRGKSRFYLGARWWVIDGFHFDGSLGGPNPSNTIQFRSSGGTGGQHLRLTNCALTNLASASSSSKWVQIYGRYNTIDHCHFSGKNSKGALVTIELGYLNDEETAHHRIAWNYFGDFAPQQGTDNETIRVGYSGDQNKPATCLVERNLFVRCNGENEIISNKSSYNTYRSNTFRQCDGALVLRHGHHARVEGNCFFGDGAKNAGGIRVVDSHHTIINNYMQDLTGTTWNAAFSILGGDQKSGGSQNGYQAVDDIVVAHNSIINCRRSIYFNDAKGSRAPTGLIANNLISSSAGPLVLDELAVDKMKWVGNLLHGAPLGVSIDAATTDPLLRAIDGLLRPSSSGPAADSAVETPVAIDNDVDGQARAASKKDIGADEVSGAVGHITLACLKPDDVGAGYLGNQGLSTPTASRSPVSATDRQTDRQVASSAVEVPGKMLDLTHWKLTLPVDTDHPGSPDEIRQPNLGSFFDRRYFFADKEAAGVVFRAHCGGSTTKGSKYPRCELREMSDGGKANAAWGTDDGVHTMTMKLAIAKTPLVKKHVVCAQIHHPDDDLMMVRLEGQKLFIERNKTGDVELDASYKLGSPFELTIQAADGQIKVWHNGRLKMTWKQSQAGCYFKAGCYTQSNASKGDAADSTGEVIIYRLQVEHE